MQMGAADIVLKLDGPARFTLRASNNPFIERWRGAKGNSKVRWMKSPPNSRGLAVISALGDPKGSVTAIGEPMGLIQKIAPICDRFVSPGFVEVPPFDRGARVESGKFCKFCKGRAVMAGW
jgi:hypothetical protein